MYKFIIIINNLINQFKTLMKVLLFIFFVQKEKEKKKNRSIKIIKLFIISQ